MSNITDTGLTNRAYDILRTLGKDADFLYDTIGRYIQDAEKDGRQDLADMWKTIKQDRVFCCGYISLGLDNGNWDFWNDKIAKLILKKLEDTNYVFS